MKHLILVKWNSLVNDKNAILPEIQKIFEQLLEIDGVFGVKIHQNAINRSNRFDIMICIEMKREILSIYDESKPHHEWKEKFGKYVENKAVFDFED